MLPDLRSHPSRRGLTPWPASADAIAEHLRRTSGKPRHLPPCPSLLLPHARPKLPLTILRRFSPQNMLDSRPQLAEDVVLLLEAYLGAPFASCGYLEPMAAEFEREDSPSWGSSTRQPHLPSKNPPLPLPPLPTGQCFPREAFFWKLLSSPQGPGSPFGLGSLGPIVGACLVGTTVTCSWPPSTRPSK